MYKQLELKVEKIFHNFKFCYINDTICISLTSIVNVLELTDQKFVREILFNMQYDMLTYHIRYECEKVSYYLSKISAMYMLDKLRDRLVKIPVELNQYVKNLDSFISIYNLKEINKKKEIYENFSIKGARNNIKICQPR